MLLLACVASSQPSAVAFPDTQHATAITALDEDSEAETPAWLTEASELLGQLPSLQSPVQVSPSLELLDGTRRQARYKKKKLKKQRHRQAATDTQAVHAAARIASAAKTMLARRHMSRRVAAATVIASVRRMLAQRRVFASQRQAAATITVASREAAPRMRAKRQELERQAEKERAREQRARAERKREREERARKQQASEERARKQQARAEREQQAREQRARERQHEEFEQRHRDAQRQTLDLLRQQREQQRRLELQPQQYGSLGALPQAQWHQHSQSWHQHSQSWHQPSYFESYTPPWQQQYHPQSGLQHSQLSYTQPHTQPRLLCSQPPYSHAVSADESHSDDERDVQPHRRHPPQLSLSAYAGEAARHGGLSFVGVAPERECFIPDGIPPEAQAPYVFAVGDRIDEYRAQLERDG